MMNTISRKKLLKMAGFAGLGMLSKPLGPYFKPKKPEQPDKPEQEMLTRTIPSSEEKLPVVGLGTWQQFDVGANASARRPLQRVLQLMRAQGGTMIDSSPMYGRAEQVVGDLTSQMNDPKHFFYATKVWTSGRQAGIDQMNSSMQKMQVETVDLMQIHNLVDWQTHLKTLQDWKSDGKIRYVGITHYRDAAHSRLE
jgi:diketogulonate reductase-like aldo/keto reductase